MAETLFIRLGSQAHNTIHWLILANATHNEPEIIASGELANAEQLSQLTEKAQQRTVNIIVPSCDVLLKALTVPAKSTRAMRLAAPYMLEDALAQDVEQLFFAYHEQVNDVAGHNCFTAVVSHKQMALWLTWLAEANIESRAFLPEVLAMPLVENNWSAITLGNNQHEQVIVRQSAWQGFTADLATWQLQCQAFSTLKQSEGGEESSGDNDDSDEVIIENYSPLPTSDDLRLSPMPEELPLALLARNFHKTKFNLLQGQYKVKDARSGDAKQWLWVAGVAMFALLLNLGFKGVQLWQINAQQVAVEEEIINTYKQAFPNTKRVRLSTIKSQLNQKLAQLGAANNGEGFLALFVKVQPAFNSVPSLKPDTVKFDGKRQELRLQVNANSYQAFEQFKNALEQQNLSVKLGAQNAQGDVVSGSFIIRSKG
ncbi:type II secretion system protein GspL [Colwellia asteriadis]|uniref:Type II secretion system protein L n=1 Tax=Colwellia asteriadis TaxID=517723 RepID=A0ABP3WEN2_9GAMM